NRPSRVRSAVGRVAVPRGTSMRRPPATPPTMRAISSRLLEEVGAIGLDQLADRVDEAGMHRERRVGVDECGRLVPRGGDDVLVAQQPEELETGPASGLHGTEHVAFASLLEVEAGEL